MACAGFEKHMVIIDKALSRATNIKEAIEATHRDLDTQLENSRVELSRTKKIQAKAMTTMEVINKEIFHLNTLLLEEQVGWAEEREQIDESFESLYLV